MHVVLYVLFATKRKETHTVYDTRRLAGEQHHAMQVFCSCAGTDVASDDAASGSGCHIDAVALQALHCATPSCVQLCSCANCDKHFIICTNVQ
jgi:hypothetical protein